MSDAPATTPAGGAPPGAPREGVRALVAAWVPIAATAFALALGLFVFYMAVYRTKHYSVPLGFDASWYIWRARFVAAHGIGPLGTAERPGTAILAALLQGTTGLSQLRLAVVLPLALVSVFALAVGAFAREVLGDSTRRWVVSILVAGVLIGATRLVSENVATLCTVLLVTAAFVPLVRRATAERGFAGAVSLLVAAGIAHWLFLAVLGGALALAATLALPASHRQLAAGVPVWRTESGTIAAVIGSAASVLAAIVFAVLRSPLNTIGVREDPDRLSQKLTTDVRRLYPWLVGPIAALGAFALAAFNRSSRSSARAMALRLMASWVGVMAVGVLYGVATKNLPPHRFLELLIAVPFALAVTEAVLIAARWIGERAGSARVPGQAVARGALFIAVALLAIPGATTWYRSGPGQWIQPAAVRQAGTAAEYMRTLPAGTPVVFLVSASGPAGVLSMTLKERTIRLGLSPELQADLYLFVGDPTDLLSGRRTVTGNPKQDKPTLPYWDGLRPVLGREPPVVVLRALAPHQFDEVVAAGAQVVGPGVALVRGPPAPRPLSAAALGPSVPPLRTAIAWGAGLLVLLFVAGIGWAVAFLGPGIAPQVLVAIAPATGTGVLMLGGLAAAEFGVRLGGRGGAATYVAVAGTGWAAAWLGRRYASPTPLRAESTPAGEA